MTIPGGKRERLIGQIFDNVSEIFRMMANECQYGRRSDSAISLVQTRLLCVVSKNPNLSLKKIARCLHVTPSAATQMVDLLDKLGFLVRKIAPSDRRKLEIVLTPKGQEELDKAHKRHSNSLQKILDPLSEKEMKQLLELHTMIIENYGKKS